MYLYSILIGLITGFIRKGKMVGISNIALKPILVIALILQFFPIITTKYSFVSVSISYGMLLLFFVKNWNYEEFRIISVGVALNALTIWTNKGRMPVDYQTAMNTWSSAKDLLNGTDIKHVLITDNTPFAIFGDVMYLKYPIPQVISIGDVILSFGLFLLVLRAMDKPINLHILFKKIQS